MIGDREAHFGEWVDADQEQVRAIAYLHQRQPGARAGIDEQT